MKLELDVHKLTDLADAIGDLAHVDDEAMRLATNRTLDWLNTRVVRRVAAVTGIQQKRVRLKIRKVPARPGTLVAALVARDGFTSLKDFHPVQQKKGVVASPWGKRHLFPGTWISAALGGHVFRHVHGSGQIKKLFGPALPKEMVKDETSGPLVELAIRTQFPMHLEYFHERAMDRVREKFGL